MSVRTNALLDAAHEGGRLPVASFFLLNPSRAGNARDSAERARSSLSFPHTKSPTQPVAVGDLAGRRDFGQVRAEVDVAPGSVVLVCDDGTNGKRGREEEKETLARGVERSLSLSLSFFERERERERETTRRFVQWAKGEPRGGKREKGLFSAKPRAPPFASSRRRRSSHRGMVSVRLRIALTGETGLPPTTVSICVSVFNSYLGLVSFVCPIS